MNRIRISIIAAALAIAVNAGWAEPLEVGSPAPRPTATTHEGRPFAFVDAYSSPWVLVFFYPKANTPGCTMQACSLRDAYEELTEQGVTVIGVSLDSIEDQASFAASHNLPFTLVADTDGSVVSAFGVPTSSRGASRFAARQAFLIRDNTVVWRDLTASTSNQARDVLMAIAEHSPGN